ncbi:MAG: methyltransferase domain-containing protein [Gemmatimonadetes bacterium]|nr:methyltransferase domain-containing protein [Gemmatimonadota bacterium]
MDEPWLDPARHRRALAALARVNRVSLTAGRVWREVRALERAGVRPLRVLDVACGGGDVLADVARRARGRGVDVELTGCDVSALALAHARERLDGVPHVRFEATDVLGSALPGRFDLVCCSLFLHHLERVDAVALLRKMADATDHTLLVQDLKRSRLGYALAWGALRVLTTSDVARTDGPISVRAAFTLEEGRGLAVEAGLDDAEVRPCWPERFTLRWVRR